MHARTHAKSAFFVAALVSLLSSSAFAEGEAPKAEEPAAAAPAEAAPAKDAPDAETTGTISVSASPNGKVFIDGVDTKQMTPLVDYKVDPGEHTLKVVDEASGREKEITFSIEAGAVLNLNLNLPEAKAEPVAKTEEKTEEAAEPAATAAAAPADDWTWMTVTGWAGVGMGLMGLVAGAVMLATPTEEQGPLGFTLFGTGSGLLLGGAVLLYLDSEFFGPDSAAPAGDEEAEKKAGLFAFPLAR